MSAYKMTFDKTGQQYFGLHMVISGGQTGADQGGLIAGYRAGLKTGGTAPAGYYTEIGNNPLLECLGLSHKGDYRTRTIKNVEQSDGTILLSCTLDSPGSRLTRNQALSTGKPFIEFDISAIVDAFAKESDSVLPDNYRELFAPLTVAIHRWLIDNNVGVLNVAGNRERHKGSLTTYAVCAILTKTFDLLDVDGLLIRKL